MTEGGNGFTFAGNWGTEGCYLSSFFTTALYWGNSSDSAAIIATPTNPLHSRPTYSAAGDCTMNCNLNAETEPTTSTPYLNYLFYTKERSTTERKRAKCFWN